MRVTLGEVLVRGRSRFFRLLLVACGSSGRRSRRRSDQRRRCPMIQAARPSLTGPERARDRSRRSWGSPRSTGGRRSRHGARRRTGCRRRTPASAADRSASPRRCAWLDAVQRRGVAAARHRATGAVEVVAGGAVGQEDLPTARDRRGALLVGEALEGVVRFVRGRRGRGRGRRRTPPGRRSPRRCRRPPCGAPGPRAGPSASGRCRPGSRPRRRRRRPATGRAGCPRRCGRPRRSARGRWSSRPGTARGPGRPARRCWRSVRPAPARTRSRAHRSSSRPRSITMQPGQPATAVPRDPAGGSVQESHLVSYRSEGAT